MSTIVDIIEGKLEPVFRCLKSIHAKNFHPHPGEAIEEEFHCTIKDGVMEVP